MPAHRFWERNISVGVSDFEGLKKAVLNNQIDLVLVGPEVPLCEGLHDFFSSDNSLKDVLFVGPYQLGAQLEGSKDFAKEFMMRHQIPTAKYLAVTSEKPEWGAFVPESLELTIRFKSRRLGRRKGCFDYE